MDEKWISTDEAQDVLGSLRQVAVQLELIQSDEQAYKWLFLAMHSALQSACICHLTTTCPPIGAATKRNTAEWLDYHEKRRTNVAAIQPKTYLLRLPDLLRNIRKPHSAGDRSNAEGIRVSDAEFEWLKRFHDEIRNQFVHFEPMGWSIEVSGVPKLLELICRIILEIHEIEWAFRHMEVAQKTEMQSLLNSLPVQ